MFHAKAVNTIGERVAAITISLPWSIFFATSAGLFHAFNVNQRF